MANYLIEIGDSSGSTLYVAMSISAASLLMPTGNAGYWRALDKGLIKPNDGALWWEEAKGTATTKHINLLSKGYWGIKLFEFKDLFGDKMAAGPASLSSRGSSSSSRAE